MSENRLFLSGEENKYNSALARGQRDRFNSKILRAQFFCYIISYFGFIFTSAYNSILYTVIFSVTSNLGVMHTIRRRVQCETALGRSRTVGYRAWRWWANTRIDQPAKPTTGAIYNQVEAVIGRKARQFVENRYFSLPHLHSSPPLRGLPSKYCHAIWYRTRTQLSPTDRASAAHTIR